MELDAADPVSEPPRDSFAALVPFADALPPGLDLLIERLEQHARAARGAFADNTLRALAADSRIFAAWCREAGRAMLPATPETVAAFIDAQAETKARHSRALPLVDRGAAPRRRPAESLRRRDRPARGEADEPRQGPAPEAGRAAQPHQHHAHAAGEDARTTAPARDGGQARDAVDRAAQRRPGRGRLRHAAAPLRARLFI
ncbi:hypothetical protein ABIE45_001337 [Methylobacterium sp. OAE515]|uniref:hypothetical protein n=1 Tax=Methylobacterium sp. OAE515 TaxID=2817895 RepID=UPI001A0E7F3D